MIVSGYELQRRRRFFLFGERCARVLRWTVNTSTVCITGDTVDVDSDWMPEHDARRLLHHKQTAAAYFSK